MNRKIIFSTLLSIAFVFLATTVVYANAKSYHGLTTIGYGNANVSYGGINWTSSRLEYTTSPFYFMDQIGATYWSTYNTCNGTIISNSVWSSSSSLLLAHNARSMGDSIGRQDGFCSGTLRRVSYISHWWQSSGFYGDGESISKTSTLLSPTFNDVPTSQWAYGWIEPMYQIGIMDIAAIRNNCPINNYFCPGYFVTRADGILS